MVRHDSDIYAKSVLSGGSAASSDAEKYLFPEGFILRSLAPLIVSTKTMSQELKLLTLLIIQK